MRIFSTTPNFYNRLNNKFPLKKQNGMTGDIFIPNHLNTVKFGVLPQNTEEFNPEERIKKRVQLEIYNLLKTADRKITSGAIGTFLRTKRKFGKDKIRFTDEIKLLNQILKKHNQREIEIQPSSKKSEYLFWFSDNSRLTNHSAESSSSTQGSSKRKRETSTKGARSPENAPADDSDDYITVASPEDSEFNPADDSEEKAAVENTPTRSPSPTVTECGDENNLSFSQWYYDYENPQRQTMNLKEVVNYKIPVVDRRDPNGQRSPSKILVIDGKVINDNEGNPILEWLPGQDDQGYKIYYAPSKRKPDNMDNSIRINQPKHRPKLSGILYQDEQPIRMPKSKPAP